ncbi:hypothetical protein Pelo_17286 [Pelomyxa schiedti]|nr:hypothetical protein Pelo_17286 [Pelomyxa schiedti]
MIGDSAAAGDTALAELGPDDYDDLDDDARDAMMLRAELGLLDAPASPGSTAAATPATPDGAVASTLCDVTAAFESNTRTSTVVYDGGSITTTTTSPTGKTTTTISRTGSPNLFRNNGHSPYQRPRYWDVGKPNDHSRRGRRTPSPSLPASPYRGNGGASRSPSPPLWDSSNRTPSPRNMDVSGTPSEPLSPQATAAKPPAATSPKLKQQKEETEEPHKTSPEPKPKPKPTPERANAQPTPQVKAAPEAPTAKLSPEPVKAKRTAEKPTSDTPPKATSPEPVKTKKITEKPTSDTPKTRKNSAAPEPVKVNKTAEKSTLDIPKPNTAKNTTTPTKPMVTSTPTKEPTPVHETGDLTTSNKDKGTEYKRWNIDDETEESDSDTTAKKSRKRPPGKIDLSEFMDKGEGDPLTDLESFISTKLGGSQPSKRARVEPLLLHPEWEPPTRSCSNCGAAGHYAPECASARGTLAQVDGRMWHNRRGNRHPRPRRQRPGDEAQHARTDAIRDPAQVADYLARLKGIYGAAVIILRRNSGSGDNGSRTWGVGSASPPPAVITAVPDDKEEEEEEAEEEGEEREDDGGDEQEEEVVEEKKANVEKPPATVSPRAKVKTQPKGTSPAKPKAKAKSEEEPTKPEKLKRPRHQHLKKREYRSRD